MCRKFQLVFDCDRSDHIARTLERCVIGNCRLQTIQPYTVQSAVRCPHCSHNNMAREFEPVRDTGYQIYSPSEIQRWLDYLVIEDSSRFRILLQHEEDANARRYGLDRRPGPSTRLHEDSLSETFKNAGGPHSTDTLRDFPPSSYPSSNPPASGESHNNSGADNSFPPSLDEPAGFPETSSPKGSTPNSLGRSANDHSAAPNKQSPIGWEKTHRDAVDNKSSSPDSPNTSSQNAFPGPQQNHALEAPLSPQKSSSPIAHPDHSVLSRQPSSNHTSTPDNSLSQDPFSRPPSSTKPPSTITTDPNTPQDEKQPEGEKPSLHTGRRLWSDVLATPYNPPDTSQEEKQQDQLKLDLIAKSNTSHNEWQQNRRDPPSPPPSPPGGKSWPQVMSCQKLESKEQEGGQRI